MRISDWSSYVCSSDLESLIKLLVFVAIGVFAVTRLPGGGAFASRAMGALHTFSAAELPRGFVAQTLLAFTAIICLPRQFQVAVVECEEPGDVRRARWLFTGYLLLICRSEEHTSELQSLMRISYAVFCLKKQNIQHTL